MFGLWKDVLPVKSVGCPKYFLLAAVRVYEANKTPPMVKRVDQAVIVGHVVITLQWRSTMIIKQGYLYVVILSCHHCASLQCVCVTHVAEYKGCTTHCVVYT